ncbi:MAG: GNAT family N-acetyltransferase [Verrucomicrobiota bacterium]
MIAPTQPETREVDAQGGAASKPSLVRTPPEHGRLENRPALFQQEIAFSAGVARVLSGEEVRNLKEWQSAFATKCKDHRFYEIVEATIEPHFEYYYLALEDLAGRTRAIQPVFFVQQNLVEGVPALKRAVNAVRRKFPRFLTMRLLMTGCAAGEGHLGACTPEDEEWVANALSSVLKILARQGKASLVVFKDFSAHYREALSGLLIHGFTRVPSMPLTKLALRYTGFENYLESLSKATRKNLRRKFRKIAKAAPIELEVVPDITPYVDEIYPLYAQVYERSPMKFERLTKEYFCSLGRRMPERTRFFIWRQQGKVIAFSLCLVHEGTIYDEYLGLDYAVAFDLHLYFYTLRDIIKWALAEGLESYCSSPLNYDPKLHLGCVLFPLDLYVMHTVGWLNPIFRRAIKFLGPTRHDPLLHRFPNADQL